MALKYKNVEAQAAAEAEYKGPWGEIIPTEQNRVRFVRDVHGVEEVWSYPYETLLRSILKKSNPQEIEILAGGDTITIRGYGLERFLEALEKRWLVLVVQRRSRFAASDPNDRCVTEIKIDPSHAQS